MSVIGLDSNKRGRWRALKHLLMNDALMRHILAEQLRRAVRHALENESRRVEIHEAARHSRRRWFHLLDKR